MSIKKIFLLKEGAGEKLQIFDLLKSYTGSSVNQTGQNTFQVIIDGQSGGLSFTVVLAPDGGIEDVVPER